MLAEEVVMGAADGERKTGTALFADIKGSTELQQDLDPEEARAMLAEIYNWFTEGFDTVDLKDAKELSR
jgi:class 3 adenylate cyclase